MPRHHATHISRDHAKTMQTRLPTTDTRSAASSKHGTRLASIPSSCCVHCPRHLSHCPSSRLSLANSPACTWYCTSQLSREIDEDTGCVGAMKSERHMML